MSKIIVAGSINMDVVASVKAHPQPGETIFGKNLRFIPGGKGANQAVAAARLGGDVHLLGKVGQDGAGTQLLDFLASEKLNVDNVTQGNSASGTALILVDAASENTIVVIPGSNAELSIEDVESIPVSQADIALAPFEVPQTTILALFKRAKATGASTILNPAPATAFIDGLHELVDVLIVNETELAFFADAPVAGDNLDILREQAIAIRSHSAQVIVMTLGTKGVFCIHDEAQIRIEGQTVQAVDTTAAGDCFTGALTVALSEGKTLADALHFANLAASLSVQKAGASSSLPYRAEVDALLNT